MKQVVVQKDLVVALAQDPRLVAGGDPKAVLEQRLHLVHQVAGLPVVGWHAEGRHVGRHVGPAVVGGQEGGPCSRAHQVVQRVKQPRQLGVQPEVHVHGFLGVRSHAVAHVVGGAEAERQQVGHVVLPQLSPFDGRQRDVHNQRVASRRALEHVETAVLLRQRIEVIGEGGLEFALERPFVGVVVGQALRIHPVGVQLAPALVHQRLGTSFVVEFLQPRGQGVAVVVARNELTSVLAEKPKRAIRGVAGRQNGPTVFHAHPEDFGGPTRRHLELVAQRGGKKAGGRHFARSAQNRTVSIKTVVAHPTHGRVRGAVHTFLGGTVVPIVADNAVHGGSRSRVDGGVARPRVGGGVAKVVVPTRKSFLDHAPEAARSERRRRVDVVPRPEAGEVVGTHLVHCDAHHQFGAGLGVMGVDADVGLDRASRHEQACGEEANVHRAPKITSTRRAPSR